MQRIVEKVERRHLPDRRKSPTLLISRYTFIGGRRKTIRRYSDRKKYIFVDIYSPQLLLMLLFLLILNISDGYLTLILIRENIAVEVNPIMSFYLELGNISFLTAKLFFTILPLFTFCICKNFSITKASLSTVMIIYISLILYELNLIFKFLPPF
ncbi:MAG: hypothetical protein HXY47_00500 [Nitrospirae bacterium]|nr:hypothetical protein [Nitrospirota bacterium]